jgi:hypothetical protein
MFQIFNTLNNWPLLPPAIRLAVVFGVAKATRVTRAPIAVGSHACRLRGRGGHACHATRCAAESVPSASRSEALATVSV